MRTLQKEYDLIIIGGGPAGLAAAVEAYDQGVHDILIVERDCKLGGILNQCIHTGFGLQIFKQELSGPEYAGNYIEMVRERNISVLLNTMVLSIEENQLVTVAGIDCGVCQLRCKALVLAMGCRERSRGAISIPGSRPAGVLTAGTAQYYINVKGYMVGREVVILGSGDIGLIMARRLTLEGAHVKMVCELEPYSNGLTRNIVQCLDDYHILLRLSHTVTEIHGKNRLNAVTIAQVDEQKQPIPGTEEIIDCDTLLLSVGLIPENELTRQLGVQVDPVTGGPVVNQKMQTQFPWIFACGNVVHVHDLVDYVTMESRRAGHAAAAYIQCQKHNRQADFKTQGAGSVRYVVPQQVSLDEAEHQEITLLFRVGKPSYHSFVRVNCGDTVIFEGPKKQRVVPGEMEKVILREAHLKKILESRKSDAGAESLTVSVIPIAEKETFS